LIVRAPEDSERIPPMQGSDSALTYSIRFTVNSEVIALTSGAANDWLYVASHRMVTKISRLIFTCAHQDK
jgi:hypothetical protein